MTKEELPEPRSPLPKLKKDSISTPAELKELYQEVVTLRQDVNAILTYLKSPES